MPNNKRLNKTEQAVVDEFGFEISAPPEKEITRRSKHEERFIKAREICMARPGQPVKIYTARQASSCYQYAKQINNSEHRQFPDGKENWTAIAAPDPTEEHPKQHGLWLTYRPGDSEE